MSQHPRAEEVADIVRRAWHTSSEEEAVRLGTKALLALLPEPTVPPSTEELRTAMSARQASYPGNDWTLNAALAALSLLSKRNKAGVLDAAADKLGDLLIEVDPALPAPSAEEALKWLRLEAETDNG